PDFGLLKPHRMFPNSGEFGYGEFGYGQFGYGQFGYGEVCMSFVQIGFLGALAALAIPIIVHLVFRQRPKRIELGTLRFLRIVLEHNARRRRVMRWLLLALRLACVALAAFLFARPYLLA